MGCIGSGKKAIRQSVINSRTPTTGGGGVRSIYQASERKGQESRSRRQNAGRWDGKGGEKRATRRANGDLGGIMYMRGW
jgi:hypothetical protein